MLFLTFSWLIFWTLFEPYEIPQKHPNNIAYIDGQNLHLGTKSDGRTIDIHKLRIYLKDKYKVSVAYYFWDMYKTAMNFCIPNFRKHDLSSYSKTNDRNDKYQKWNIDSDMIFHIMAKLIDDWATWDKIILVSWDGDFKILIDYLIKKTDSTRSSSQTKVCFLPVQRSYKCILCLPLSQQKKIVSPF